MRRYDLIRVALVFLIGASSCNTKSQEVVDVDRKVGGRCEGCEAILEYGDSVLDEIDTLPLFESMEPKILIHGKVYKKDGSTPAANTLLYIYQTNKEGIYEKRGDEQGWATRHGFIRGCVKTNEAGEYSFYTFRPGAYPNRRAPEHIHITVKEPGLTAYYLDDFMFDNDPHLTKEERNRRTNRGGSGIVKVENGTEIKTIKRDIFLGLNIPNY